MHYVILHTVGRKSAKHHKVALPFWRDADGHRIVIALYAASPTHPAWYLNLLDRDANPDVYVKVQGGEYRTRPRSWRAPSASGSGPRCLRTGRSTPTTRRRSTASSR